MTQRSRSRKIGALMGVDFIDFLKSINNSVSWPTDETSGDVLIASNPAVPAQSILASSAYPGTELIVDGDMEAVGTAAWTSTGTIAKDTNYVYSGNQSLKFTRTAAGNGFLAYQIAPTEIGKQYRFQGYCRRNTGEGADAIGYRIGTSVANFSLGDTFSATGGVDEWREDIVIFAATSTTTYIQCVIGIDAGDIGYFDNISVREVNPLNADVTGAAITATSGVTFPYARTYNGTTNYTDIYSVELNSVLDPTDFSFGIFVQKDTWDTTERDLFSLDVDANNYIRCTDTTTAGTIQFEIKAGGGTSETIPYVTGSPTGWFYVDLTVTGGNLIASFNGAVVGTPQAVAGTFTGNLTSAVIGARTTAPANVHLGDLSVPYMGMLRSFTQSEKLTIAQKAGVA